MGPLHTIENLQEPQCLWVPNINKNLSPEQRRSISTSLSPLSCSPTCLTLGMLWVFWEDKVTVKVWNGLKRTYLMIWFLLWFVRSERDIYRRVAHTYWGRGCGSAGLWVIRASCWLTDSPCTQGWCWMPTLTEIGFHSMLFWYSRGVEALLFVCYFHWVNKETTFAFW